MALATRLTRVCASWLLWAATCGGSGPPCGVMLCLTDLDVASLTAGSLWALTVALPATFGVPPGKVRFLFPFVLILKSHVAPAISSSSATASNTCDSALPVSYTHLTLPTKLEV